VTGSLLLFPLLLLFGVYIFVHGHLGPGGGFQGGVVIASAVLLLLLADPQRKISHGLLTWIESLSGLFFAGIGIAGLVLAGGFLDNRILPLGIPGELFSAGAIPLIYSLVGLKVGSELAGILDALRKEEEE
jgi:multicomponent Na+:H+ antiporter subunit B